MRINENKKGEMGEWLKPQENKIRTGEMGEWLKPQVC